MTIIRTIVLASVACLHLAPLQASPCSVATTAETAFLKVLVLPPRTHVLRMGVVKLKEVGDWEVAARSNLEAALSDALGRAPCVSLSPVPTLSAEEERRIDEFVGVATLVATSLEDSIWGRSAARRPLADRSLGTSLAFLQERSGADYVFGTFAHQLEQSRPRAAMTSVSTAAFVAGLPPLWFLEMTGSYVATFMADLRTGEVRWYNVSRGYEIAGYNFGDLRELESVRKTVVELLETFPAGSWSDEPPTTTAPDHATWRGPDQGGFAAKFLGRWMVVEGKDTVVATRDGRALNQISIGMRNHRDSTQLVARQTDSRTKPELLAQYFVEQLQERQLQDLEVTIVATDQQIMGKPAFRLRYTWSMPAYLGGAKMAGVASGVVTAQDVLIAELNAPALSYFDKVLPDFESALQSIKPRPRRHLQ